jgi:hypothetical protein
MNSQGQELGGIISPAMKGRVELQIKTLQNAPRDADKLRQLLKSKEGKGECNVHRRHT